MAADSNTEGKFDRRKARGGTAKGDPTEFVGYDDAGNVRPADDRYLTDAQVAKRDEYVEEVTGPDAQQLIAKRDRDEPVEPPEGEHADTAKTDDKAKG